MILFYSNSCRHCNVLLETIKKHDTKKTIKLVVIDSIVNKISHKIKAVPALMFIDTKEIIYGKSVFDFLLLPNRGYLFSSNNTREKPDVNNNTNNSNSNNDGNKEIEPMSFSLGAISSESFTDITDDDINSLNLNEDKVYKWGLINDSPNNSSNSLNSPNTSISTVNTKIDDNENSKKNLPSIDELQKQRDLLFK